MTIRPRINSLRRTAANSKSLLSGAQISFHCRLCGRARFEVPTDIGSPAEIILICASCAATTDRPTFAVEAES